MNIQENLTKVMKDLPQGVTLVAVSKQKPIEDIEKAYQWGQRIFGENRPQELAAKHAALPKDIQWHMIGQLQEKNVKYIAAFVSLIHSVDSLKILAKIDREAQKEGRVIDCLLEFHIAREETKSGFTYAGAVELLESNEYKNMQHVRIRGVMGLATYTSDQEQIRREFRELHHIFELLKTNYFAAREEFCEISMGMTEDYPIAVEEGSTMVRIGSGIFGERMYHKN